MAEFSIKQLAIKTGVVKRLTKETISHKKEADVVKKRIENLKNSGGDIHLIKKQEEILAECLMMIPECRKRLQLAVHDLNQFLNSDPELKRFAQFQNAKTIHNEAELLFD